MHFLEKSKVRLSIFKENQKFHGSEVGINSPPRSQPVQVRIPLTDKIECLPFTENAAEVS